MSIFVSVVNVYPINTMGVGGGGGGGGGGGQGGTLICCKNKVLSTSDNGGMWGVEGA